MKKSAYELSNSQVTTPSQIVDLFWSITHKYRPKFSRVLDFGAGDGRFAWGGKYDSYDGVEIDRKWLPSSRLPENAKIHSNCIFKYKPDGYSACIGNPPYVRHHDLDDGWRDMIASQLSCETGWEINKKCNLYVYFLFLALLKSNPDGLVSFLIPYEWVSRPSSLPLRNFIKYNGWHVDTYRFQDPIFKDVLTTASISIIDKKNHDSEWRYHEIDTNGKVSLLEQITGSNQDIFPYEKRGSTWAMRGMSPGTQKVFTLTEGQRIHFGLKDIDVHPCVTSLRGAPSGLTQLTATNFRKFFVNTGEKCWLIKSYSNSISPRLSAYLESVPLNIRNTWTCSSRKPWYRYILANSPGLLMSTGFTSFGPKILINSIGAYAIGSVCGIYTSKQCNWSRLRDYLTGIDFEKRVVPHANNLKKIEIRQLNGILNAYREMRGSR